MNASLSKNLVVLRPAEGWAHRAWVKLTVWVPAFGYRAEYRRLATAQEFLRLAGRYGWARVAKHSRQLGPAVRARIKRGLI